MHGNNGIYFVFAEDVRFSSESLTVTFVLTSATDSSSSAATDSLQPVEMPRQTADASGR